MAASPFPWLPMLAISTGLVSHSYALTSLFPYVGFMVQHLGVTGNKDEAGYYAGYVASAFMIGRFGSSYFWGSFADRYGRLPVIYVGLGCMVVLSIAFGLSTSFAWAIGCRFLLGASNGLLGISKTMISEVCGPEHEVVGMSFILGSSSIGMVIGPGLGGLLAEPANHYPAVFSESALFGRFPYLLPNIAGASLALAGLPLVFFFLKETRHSQNNRGEDDSRDERKRLPEPEAGGASTAAEEEARVPEMAPLMAADSAEGIGDGGFRNLRRKRSVSSKGWRPAGHAAEDAIGSIDIELAPVDNDDTGGPGGDPLEEGRRLLSSRSGDEEQLGFAGGVRHHPLDAGRWFRQSRGVSDVGEVEDGADGDGSGGEGRWLWRNGRRRARTACWRECRVLTKLLGERRTRTIVFVYAFFSFISIGAREVYPLWALSTVASGGLDWTTKQIGEALSACGIGMLIFQLLVYPRLSKRIGVTRSHRVACLVSVPVYLAFPLLSRLHDSGRVLIVASLLLLFLANLISSVVFINVALVTNNAVDPSLRATLNGLSMTVGSLAKAAGPTFFSSIFAWSIDGPHHPFPFEYHLSFYLLALGMVVVIAVSWNTIVYREPLESKAAGVDPSLVPQTEQPLGKGASKSLLVQQRCSKKVVPAKI